MQNTRRFLGSVCVAALVVAGSASTALAGSSGSQSVVVSQTPVPWTPQVLNGRVQAMVQVGNQIVVGGGFTQVRVPGGPTLARTNLFAFDATTGAIDPNFAPTIAGGRVFALSPTPDGSGVFVGGRFAKINGKARHGVVKLPSL